MKTDQSTQKLIAVRTPTPDQNQKIKYLTLDERLAVLLQASQVKVERLAKAGKA